MADPIPKDHLRLDEAFDMFRTLKRGADCNIQPTFDDPNLDLWRKTYSEQLEFDENELKQPFSEGVLEALVSSADRKHEYRILPEEWRKASWPTRVFISDDIFDFHDGPFAKHDGRSAYISRTHFEEWLHLWFRNWLLNELMYGRIKPEEAEKKALKAGLTPLASIPDPGAFDPRKKPDWSFTMAIAWMAWGTIEAVRQCWTDYCEAHWFFVFQEWRLGFAGDRKAGWELKQNLPNISRLRLQEAYNQSHGVNIPTLSINDAITLLWQALGESKISATGIDETTGNRRVLLAHEWQDLKLVEERGRDALQKTTGLLSGTIAYRLPTISQIDVMKEWSNLGQALSVSIKGSANKSKLLGAVREVVREVWPSGVPGALKSKDRNNLIRQRVKSLGGSEPSDRTIARALKR